MTPFYRKDFLYVPDFISEQEEIKLLEIISGIELQTFIFQDLKSKENPPALDWIIISIQEN